MELRIKGIDGEYVIFNRSSIVQYKLDAESKKISEKVTHIITDSIENNQDRYKISKLLINNI